MDADKAGSLPRSARTGNYFRFPRVDAEDDFVYAEGDFLGLPRDLLSPVKLVDLAEAIRRINCNWYELPMGSATKQVFEPVDLYVYEIEPADFWEYARERHDDVGIPDVCKLEILGAQVVASVEFEIATNIEESDVWNIAESVVDSANGDLVEVEILWSGTATTVWQVKVALPPRGRRVGELVDLARAVRGILSALDGPELTAGTAMKLIEAGQYRWMSGFEENGWFEAKQQLWDLSTVAGKIELAQDVARFANASGGLIVVGATTKRKQGIDTVTRIGGIRFGTDVQQIQSVLDSRVIPVLHGLVISVVSMEGGREICAIYVSPQTDALKPYLVQGTVVDGKVEGAFFSIVQRRGEGSIVVDARTVHTWISLGRRVAAGEHGDRGDFDI